MSMSLNDPGSADQGLVKPQRSGWSSPFASGSRANSRPPSRTPSRSVTPSHSSNNLREKAASQAQTPASNGDLTAVNAKLESTRSTLSVNRPDNSKRKSFFSVRKKSQVDLHEDSNASEPVPPLPTAPNGSTHATRATQGSAAKNSTPSSAAASSPASNLTRRRSKSESLPRQSRISRFFGRKPKDATKTAASNSTSTSGSATPSAANTPQQQPSKTGGPQQQKAAQAVGSARGTSPQASERPTVNGSASPQLASLGIPAGKLMHSQQPPQQQQQQQRRAPSSSPSFGSGADDLSPPTSESQDGASVSTPSTEFSTNMADMPATKAILAGVSAKEMLSASPIGPPPAAVKKANMI